MINWTVQILVSVIFILLTIIQSKKTFKKDSPRDILEDRKKWKGGHKEFIEFKKYEYDRNFWYISLIFGFNTVLFGIFFTLKDLFINLVGLYPWIILILCSLYAPSRFLLFIIPRANGRAIENVKILLELKEESNKERYSMWVKSSFNLQFVELLLLSQVQGLGKIDVELIEEFPQLKLESKNEEDRITKNRYVTLSELWVMGAYELLRVLNQILKANNGVDENSKAKVKEAFILFQEIRVPLVKFEKTEKERTKRRLYSQITWPFFDKEKGIGWTLNDGSGNPKKICRKDLSDKLLETLEGIKIK